MVYHAAKRRRALESEHDGLVFGRLDLGPDGRSGDGADAASADPVAPGGEVRYIGRLGLRDETYESLVVDWRGAGGGAVLPGHPHRPGWGSCARRSIRSSNEKVISIEDDLLDPDAAPSEMAVIGRRGAAGEPVPRHGHRHEGHRRDDPARAGRRDPLPQPGRDDRARRARHRQDRGRPAPRGVSAVCGPEPVRVRRGARRGPLGRLRRVRVAGAAVPRRGHRVAAFPRAAAGGGAGHPARAAGGRGGQGFAAHAAGAEPGGPRSRAGLAGPAARAVPRRAARAGAPGAGRPAPHGAQPRGAAQRGPGEGGRSRAGRVVAAERRAAAVGSAAEA